MCYLTEHVLCNMYDMCCVLLFSVGASSLADNHILSCFTFSTLTEC